MKKILLTILCILYCSLVHAMDNRHNEFIFNDVIIWGVIPYDDGLTIVVTEIEGIKGNGVIFTMESEAIEVDQTIACTADPPKIFAARIRDIINATLMIHLDFYVGEFIFDFLEESAGEEKLLNVNADQVSEFSKEYKNSANTRLTVFFHGTLCQNIIILNN